MVVREFGTGEVAPRDRFALFQAFTARSHMPERLDSEHRDDFRAALHVLDLGDVQVSVLANSHLSADRTPALIRRRDPEVYQLHFVLRGEGSVSQGGNHTAVRAGDLFLLDSGRPYQGEFRSPPGQWSNFVVRCPRTLLALPERSVRRMASVALPGDQGVAGVLRRWLTDIDSRAHELTAADLPTLSSVTVELVASVLARCVDERGAAAQEARRRALRVRVRDFVDQRLGDPELTPEAIAAAHAISLRSLYRIFQEEGLTVAGWIRERRLEACRRDLADPALRSRPLHTVATRWGFTDHTHFSRAFRAAYGVSPRDYRHAAASGGGGFGDGVFDGGRFGGGGFGGGGFGGGGFGGADGRPCTGEPWERVPDHRSVS